MQVPEELRKELSTLPENFYGSVELSFQDGLPVLVKTIATKKIYQERDYRHGNKSR